MLLCVYVCVLVFFRPLEVGRKIRGQFAHKPWKRKDEKYQQQHSTVRGTHIYLDTYDVGELTSF